MTDDRVALTLRRLADVWPAVPDAYRQQLAELVRRLASLMLDSTDDSDEEVG